MAEHGSISTYTNHGCRCAACRSAWAAYHRERDRKNPRHRGTHDHGEQARIALRQREKARIKANRVRVAEIKLASGCTDCGYNVHSAALHFDHLPEFEKVQEIGLMMSAKWSRIEAEMAKCEIVCANCHAVRTFERHLSGQTPVPPVASDLPHLFDVQDLAG